MKARIISVAGESHPRIEDFWYIDYNGKRLKAGVGDWAHDLTGELYHDEEIARLLNESEGRYNGGIIGSALARRIIAETEATGQRLIELINREIERKYRQYGIRGYREDRGLTFTGYVTYLLTDPKQTVITAVGNVSLATNGRIIYERSHTIETRNAELRIKYIEETGDSEGAYRRILPYIMEQFEYQNQPGSEFSYAAIDGTETLPEGIDTMLIPTPRHILLWSDGYETPDEFTIEGLERKLQEVYRIDPHRCKEYPAVGELKDDRTALEIIIDNWEELQIEHVSMV